LTKTRTAVAIADDRALGGSLRVIVTHEPDLAAAKAAVDEVVRAVDLAANRFREDSELSRLNATTDRDVVISPLLTKLIAAALRGARLTGGAVDPTVGSAIKLAGYDADFATVPADGMAIELVVSRIPGWQAVVLDEATRTVRLPRGVDIDLGATAKALTSDLAAAAALTSVSRGGGLLLLQLGVAFANVSPSLHYQQEADQLATRLVQRLTALR